MTICLDIDGVIANPYAEVNRRVHEAGFKTIVWEHWTQFDVSKIYDWCDPKFIKDLFRDKLVMKNAIPFRDSWLWINHMHYENDEEIVYVTHRIDYLSKVTWEWFADWEIPCHDIHFVHNKSEFINSLDDVSFFVEDNTHNANDAHSAGIKTYLINRNYNKNDTPVDGVSRINSLWEIEY
jgi:uncharacterized HAD superfamily protein